MEYVLSGCQQDFPIVDAGRIVGVLTRGDLLTGLTNQGQSGLVGEAMRREFSTAEPTEMVEAAWGRLQEDDCRILPVVQQGELVGILTAENLGEFLMIQAALHKSPKGQKQVQPRFTERIEPWAA